ncbi:MAG: RNA polymerase sigma-70 factor [Bacteroidetes bacterium]|nr:RNA polymerase sigma-70 factor [Bacteroidota bacterium]
MKLPLSDSEQSFKHFFDEHFHYLVLHSYKLINDYSQSEEIVQDVFVKVWQNFEQIEHISDYKAYLYKSVHNSSLNYLRHIKIRQKYNEAVANTFDEAVKPTEELIVETEKNNRILKAINKLPENWKEAIVLSKYDKLKYHEIAKKMNISQKTVEKYISKALSFLRKELADLLITIAIILNFIK